MSDESAPTIQFTPEEIAGVEKLYNVKWTELTETGQLFRGLIYRIVWSPKAIANRIINGDGSRKE